MKTKMCSFCKQMKDVTEFCKNKSQPDGLQSYCKSCNKEYMRRRYARARQPKNAPEENISRMERVAGWFKGLSLVTKEELVRVLDNEGKSPFALKAQTEFGMPSDVLISLFNHGVKLSAPALSERFKEMIAAEKPKPILIEKPAPDPLPKIVKIEYKRKEGNGSSKDLESLTIDLINTQRLTNQILSDMYALFKRLEERKGAA